MDFFPSKRIEVNYLNQAFRSHKVCLFERINLFKFLNTMHWLIAIVVDGV